MSQPFIGQIIMFGGTFAPRGWAFCNGQLLAISSNQALFSILGTTYGGDGETSFGLPDLRGRAAMHAGSGPGLTPRPLGQRAGVQDTTLTVNNMPSHNHPASSVANCVVGPGNTNVASANFWSKDFGGQTGTYNSGPADGTMASNTNNLPADNAVTTTVENTGSGQAFNNMQPYQVTNYIIALEGLFPSRN